MLHYWSSSLVSRLANLGEVKGKILYKSEYIRNKVGIRQSSMGASSSQRTSRRWEEMSLLSVFSGFKCIRGWGLVTPP